MPGEIKLDVNRLTKEELGYELRVRGLGEGGNLTVVEMRAVLRNALHLEKTSLAIKSPTYPYKFAEDSVALTANLDTVNSLIDEFCGIANDSKYKGIMSKIAHALGRVNRSSPSSEAEKETKMDIRLKLLLAVDRLQEKTKKDRKTRDSTVFDLSVLRQTVGQPGAHSSAMEAEHSSSDEEQVVKLKPVPVRDWGLKFTGRPGDMSFTTFLERVEEKRRSRGISRARLFTDAVDLFESDAHTWYNLVKNWATDWESLIELMREQFLPENFDRDLFEEIKRRTQGSQESIGLYIASMIGLFNKMRTPIAEETQLEMILERIDPYYHPFLAFENITSVTQLLTYCRKLDVKRGLAKSYIPPPPKKKSLVPELAYASTSTSVSSSHSSLVVGEVPTTRLVTIKCFNCEQVGHRHRTCPSPKKIFCFNCAFGKPPRETLKGRVAPPDISSSTVGVCDISQQIFLDYVIAQVTGDQRPYLEVSVLGFPMMGLLDSGASRTLVGATGYEILRQIGLSLQPMVTQCKVANGQMCASIGYVSTPVTLGDKARIIDILVIPELPHKLILGVDFWVSMNIIPDLRQRIWHFSDHEPSTEVCSILDETSLNPNQKPVLEQLVENNRKLMDPENRKLAFARIYKDVQAKLSKAYDRSKHHYNLRRRLDQFSLNQKVWRRSHAQSDATKHFSAKLAPKFVGPFIISKIVSPWTYELRDPNGKRTVWHIKDLKAHPPDSE
ncbi:hypothetical protein NQ314_019981 [Rhamnusium bicolor]|uniref:CCHC-type domain-containing protein n=1 Tax=Rhamnusium bicolor TaxID=1586634 RepID=A0AAV8WM16_9CUCU|nr:hypothetical protein NQ314_019981 [Rhamnusium bicolor]